MKHESDQRERMHRLYHHLQPQLLRILATNVQAPSWVIEEASQTAWGSLLQRGSGIAAGGELGWLATTATRTALRLLRRERLADAREEPVRAARHGDSRASSPGPEDNLLLRERLGEIRRLPARQQRVIMLHGFGYEYGEIALATGETPRTVARQLTRARQRLLRLVEET